MIDTSIFLELSIFAQNQGYSYISGAFSGFIGEDGHQEEVGDVQMLISHTGKYFVWHHDENTGRIVGKFDRGHDLERLELPAHVPMDEKLAVINGLSAEICS